MTERRTEQVPLLDGSQLRLTIAETEYSPRGGIVVLHEARGVTPAVWHLATSLAGEGWLSVIPHLYHRDGADEVIDSVNTTALDTALDTAALDTAASETAASAAADTAAVDTAAFGDGLLCRHVERLSADSVLADADASCRWLGERGIGADRIGVAGFGLGGGVALLVAAHRNVGAAVTVGGLGVVQPLSPALPALVDAAPELRCPWLGIYCRGGGIAEEEVHKLADAADCAHVATDLVYFTEDRCRFGADQPAAVEAWTRTLNWFDAHLR